MFLCTHNRARQSERVEAYEQETPRNIYVNKKLCKRHL